MAAFHVRDIPPHQLEELRKRAMRHGRSMNAEMLAILDETLSRPDAEEWLAWLDQLNEKYAGRTWDPAPEELIRQDRDSH